MKLQALDGKDVYIDTFQGIIVRAETSMMMNPEWDGSNSDVPKYVPVETVNIILSSGASIVVKGRAEEIALKFGIVTK
jgi:hypothetical protein